MSEPPETVVATIDTQSSIEPEARTEKFQKATASDASETNEKHYNYNWKI